MDRPFEIIRSILLSLALLSASPFVSAAYFTGNVQGRVAVSGSEPLAGARVTLFTPEADRIFTTSSSGDFFFAGVRPGHYTVQAEAAGYETVVLDGVDVDSTRTTSVAFSLEAATDQSITLEQETRLLDPRAGTEGKTLTSSSLMFLPRLDDLSTTLAEVPGIGSSSSDANVPPAFSSMGSTSPVTVRIDGVSVASSDFSIARIAAFDLENLEQIRVVRSATAPEDRGSAPDVLIVTPRGRSEFAGSLYGYAVAFSKVRDFSGFTGIVPVTNGLDGKLEGGAEAGGPLLSNRLWAWGSVARSSADLRTGNPGFLGLSSTTNETRQNERFRLDWRLNEHFSVAGWWAQGTGTAGVEIGGPAKAGFDLRTVEASALLSPTSLVTVTAARGTSSEEEQLLVPVSLRSAENTVRLDGSVYFGGHLAQELSFGAETAEDHSKASAPPISSFLSSPFEASARSGGVYFLDTLRWRTVTVEAGGRLQRDSLAIQGEAGSPTSTGFLPRLGLLWAPGTAASHDVFRLRFGRYSDSVSRCFEGQAIVTCGLDATLPVADARLQAAESDEALAGWEHEISPQFTVGASLTHRRYSQELGGAGTVTENGRVELLNVAGNRDSDLTELHIEKRLSIGVMIHGFAAYENAGSVDAGAVLPPLSTGSRWSWQLSGLVQLPMVKIDVATVLSGGQGPRLAGTANDRLDDRFQLDIRAGKHYDLRRINLALLLDVFNVTNESSELSRQRNLFPQSETFVTLQDPTTFRLGAQVRF